MPKAEAGGWCYGRGPEARVRWCYHYRLQATGRRPKKGAVVELADTLALGASKRKLVRVQISPAPPIKSNNKNIMKFNGYVSKGEQVVFSVHPSVVILVVQLAAVVFGIVSLMAIFFLVDFQTFFTVSKFFVFLVVLLVGLFLVLVTFLSWYKTYYILTKSRVRYFSGILGVQNKDMTLEDIQNVQYQQTFWGTIFHYGNIFIRSSAHDTPIVFNGISNPRVRASLLRKLAKV